MTCWRSGGQTLPRTELTEKLWNYIRKADLQDKKQKTLIHADEPLKAVFNGEGQVSMFEMPKLRTPEFVPEFLADVENA